MKKKMGLSLWMLFLTLASAQAQVGKITGKVVDKATKEPLIGASVRIDGTRLGATADINGKYTLLNVPAGKYTLKVSYVGYTSDSLSGVKVIADSVTTLPFELTASTVTAQEISVLSERPLIEKSATTTMRIISKEEIKNLPTRGLINSDPQNGGILSGNDLFLFNAEEYGKIVENEFLEAMKNPLSTFSIDVDAAAYANVRRFLTQGEMPPKDAVRTEELINNFTYDYPQPTDEHPFSITTELAPCPWNAASRLALIGLQGRKIQTENLPASNLTFLIDVSGSMNQENKLPLVKAAFRLLVEQLRPQDKVAVVVYAGAAGLVLPMTAGNRKADILKVIDRLEAGGSTAGGAGIGLAYSIAKENFLKDGNNRVVLATDGDFNVGASSDGELVRLIEEKRNDGIFLSVLGFGMGNYKDSKMQQLADKGNGNHYYIDNLREAKKVLVGQMAGTLFTIAKDVKLQLEFNPAKVKSYRLIGYENRLLAKEDFDNDKKDAGELGAGHSVTALYEIIPADSLGAPDDLKYQTHSIKPAALTSNEVMTVKFRYKQPKSDDSKLLVKVMTDKVQSLDAASTNLRFAASVALFAMVLTDSKFKGTATYPQVLQAARNAKGTDAEGYRAEFIKLVETAETLSKQLKAVKE